jgi:hypothetical protein
MQLTVKGTLQEQVCSNVYYYTCLDAATGSCAELVATFFDTILGPLEAILSNQYHMFEAVAINLNNADDFSVTPMDSPGIISGDPYPPFVAMEFKYNRLTRVSRNGYKRYAGVPESASTDGVNPTSAYATLCQDLADVLSANLVGALTQYVPVIFRKTSAAHEPLAGTGFAVDTVSVRTLTSQISRKIGHGT